MGQPSPRKTDLVLKSGMKVFEGKESKGRSGREEWRIHSGHFEELLLFARQYVRLSWLEDVGKEVNLFKEKGSFYRLEEELVDFSARGKFTLWVAHPVLKVRKPQERGANSSNVVAYRDLDSISKRDSFVVLGASSAVKKEAIRRRRNSLLIGKLKRRSNPWNMNIRKWARREVVS